MPTSFVPAPSDAGAPPSAASPRHGPTHGPQPQPQARRHIRRRVRTLAIPVRWQGGTLPLDISERDGDVVVRASLPGFAKTRSTCSCPTVLSITAKREQEHEQSGERYVRRERSHEAVSRSIALPAPTPTPRSRRSSRTACSPSPSRRPRPRSRGRSRSRAASVAAASRRPSQSPGGSPPRGFFMSLPLSARSCALRACRYPRSPRPRPLRRHRPGAAGGQRARPRLHRRQQRQALRVSDATRAGSPEPEAILRAPVGNACNSVIERRSAAATSLSRRYIPSAHRTASVDRSYAATSAGPARSPASLPAFCSSCSAESNSASSTITP